MSRGPVDLSADFDALRTEIARLDASSEEDAAASLAAMLAHRSWSLRDLVVEALARREDLLSSVLRRVEEGDWWARASACDVLARRPHATAVPALLRAVEDRNVSLQRSAVRALLAVAESCGMHALVACVAVLAPEGRRRVIARFGHQAPHAIDEFLQALAAVPQAAEPEPRAVAASPVLPVEDAETRALRGFRSWLVEHASRAGQPVAAS